jgi:photosystem II stability/assembly factor-like uncharacterized protein
LFNLKYQQGSNQIIQTQSHESNFLTILCAFLYCASSIAQVWQQLPNAPAAEFVNDDLFFIGEKKGWMVNLDGFIYHTEDAGETWDTLLIKPGTAFRSIGFIDSLHGFAGNLGPGSWISNVTDTNPLYETTDGGQSWNPVLNISGTFPHGLCGINVVNDSVIYAVGRYAGPCVVVKTTDGGASWVSSDLSDKFVDLIDVWFFSADTGVIVGGNGLRSVIYYTTDGGNSWENVFTNTQILGWHWKVSFPSRYIGYASIEGGNSNASRVAKTTDGGLSWELKPLVPPSNGDATGIGFINDSVGWVGFWYPGEDYMTTDGGETWELYPLDPQFNRFRKINDSVAYICGERVWKYESGMPLGMVNSNQPASGYHLEQNIPNPFSEKTTIHYTIPEKGFVTLKIFDAAGRTIRTLVKQDQEMGSYSYEFSLPKSDNAYFICKLSVNGYQKIIKMTKMKD